MISTTGQTWEHHSRLKSKVSVAPTFYAVTLQEAKDWLRVTFTHDDQLITSLISQATDLAERYTGRKFANQTLIGYGDRPRSNQAIISFDDSGYALGPISSLGGELGFLDFDWGPVQSVTSIETIDIDNTETVYSSGNYYLENFDDDLGQRIRFDSNASPPGSLRSSNAWKVTYVAGYGATQASIPLGIQMGVKMLVAHLYRNRGACGESCVSASGAMGSLESFRIVRL